MRQIFYRTKLTMAVVLGLTPLCLSPASAMEARVTGDQLILSGAVVDGDAVRVRVALQNPGITTVILRNSQGGDYPTGYRVGDLIRERGLRTAVSGYCYGPCAQMFLGGRSRYFTDDFGPQTNVGFNGHYYDDGLLDQASVKQYHLRERVISYTDGKADPNLVDRWLYMPSSQGMIHFYNPAARRGAAATLLCDSIDANGGATGCDPVRRTALDLGIVTSLDTLHSADRPQSQVAMLR